MRVAFDIDDTITRCPKFFAVISQALMAAIDFLVETRGLSAADAYTLASLAVDFSVAEAVNETQVVVASVPKALFAE